MTDREKLVELLAQVCEWGAKRCIGCKEDSPAAAECREERFGKVADHLIANGVAVHEWISVKDGLPENEQEVIGWEGDYAEILYYDAEFNEWNDANGWRVKLNKFPHWMPLPEPPKIVSAKICNCSQERPILRIKLKQDKPENWIVKEDLSLYEKISKQYSIEQSSCKSCEHSYVEPVRYGEWEHDTCSICGAEWFDWTNMRPFATNYCPSCGAKMNGGKE